jgi:hypothetical protein
MTSAVTGSAADARQDGSPPRPSPDAWSRERRTPAHRGYLTVLDGSAEEAAAGLAVRGGPAARGQGIARLGLAPGEWALARMPPGMAQSPRARWCARRAARELVRRYQPGPGPHGRCEIVRVPAAIDARLGRAVLHYGPAGAVIYCPASEITGRTAEARAAFARWACEAPGTAPGELAVRVLRVDHGRLPSVLHPAVAVACGPDMATWVCADLITVGLAETLGAICTAQASYLLPSAQ